MKRVLLSVVAAFALSVPAAVLSATSTTGTVTSYDAATYTLLLDDGGAYAVPPIFHGGWVAPGRKVDISWDETGTGRLVRTIEAYDATGIAGTDGIDVGTITAVDRSRARVTLDDDVTYVLPGEMKDAIAMAQGLMPGNRLMVHWHRAGTGRAVDVAEVIAK